MNQSRNLYSESYTRKEFCFLKASLVLKRSEIFFSGGGGPTYTPRFTVYRINGQSARFEGAVDEPEGSNGFVGDINHQSVKPGNLYDQWGWGGGEPRESVGGSGVSGEVCG